MATRRKASARKPRDLAEYRAKRDFGRSPEPSGAATPRRPRKGRRDLTFCVQKHLASRLHYDFRLEYAGVLLSWAVPKGPSLDPSDKRLAMRTEDHPLDYGEFEGVIPEGYGAGIVMLWDRGTWEPEPPDADIAAALDKGELKFRLDGFKLKGSWVLVQTGKGDDPRRWLLIKHRDDWSGPLDVTEAAPLSIVTQRDFADILAADDPAIWQSHQPAKSGITGKMFADIIAEAVERRLAKRDKGKPRRRSSTSSAAPRAKRAARSK